jgi:hypothetical protein
MIDRRTEKATELIERATKLGLRFEFDSGLILVKRTETGDPQRQDDIIAEIGKYLSEVRRLVYLRAMAVRAKDFLGQRIWSGEGEGVLASASVDGDLSITVTQEGFRHQRTVTAKAESLLIVVGQEAIDGASSTNDEPTPETPRKRRFGVF